MSPKKVRKNHSTNQSVTTRNRTKTHNRTQGIGTILYDEEDLENQEKNHINVSVINSSQLKHEKDWNTRLSKKKVYSETPEKRCISTRSISKKNVVDNNSLIDINNISYELLEQSSRPFKYTSMCYKNYKKAKQLKKSSEQSSINLDINNKEESVYNKSFNETITPKSSPIAVTLTPLRTTKTPKKSPLNLASPKTHSEVPLRLSKTPRKLKMFINSATESTSPNTSFENKEINMDIQNTTLDSITTSDVKVKSNKLRKSRTSAEKLNITRRRLPKSAKIVLKSPKSESPYRKLKGPLVNQTDRGISMPKLRSSSKTVSKIVSAFSNKNNTDHESLLDKESDLELTLTKVNDLSLQYKEIMLNDPVVILERIPLLDSLSESLKTHSNQRLMDTTLEVARHVQQQLFKDLNSLKHSVSYIKQNYLMSSLSKNFNSEKNQELDNTSFIVSSTPVKVFKPQINNTIPVHLSPESASTPISSNRTYNSPSTPISSADKRRKQNILVEKYIKNCTYDMNETNDGQNNTMVVENEETAADVTYDLLEPKTPHLLERCKKRRMVDVISDKKEIKKGCKVRFTTPENRMKILQPSSKTAIRKTPVVKHKQHKRSSSVPKTFINKSTSNFEVRRRSNSISGINITPYKNNKKMEKTTTFESDKRKHITENEREKEIKPQTVKKKIPNFSEIHKQMFAKMESLVDNKKRLIQKHEALKTPIASKLRNNMKNIRSSETKSWSYNRFGFKIKKAEATNIVLRRQQTNVKQEKREENKAFLKGVRTNRRFELQMKMRKITD